MSFAHVAILLLATLVGLWSLDRVFRMATYGTPYFRAYTSIFFVLHLAYYAASTVVGFVFVWSRW